MHSSVSCSMIALEARIIYASGSEYAFDYSPPSLHIFNLLQPHIQSEQNEPAPSGSPYSTYSSPHNQDFVLGHTAEIGTAKACFWSVKLRHWHCEGLILGHTADAGIIKAWFWTTLLTLASSGFEPGPQKDNSPKSPHFTLCCT